MACKRRLIRLGDVCTKIGSGATPRGGSEVYLESSPYALIRSQNVYNDGFHRGGLAYIGEIHAAELDAVEVFKGDVLLNITGDSVARACQVDPEVLPARVNQHVAIIRPEPDKLDPQFLRYLLVSPEIQSQLLSWAGSGGTRNALTKAMIESFDVLAPEDVDEQRAIAHILGTLDDKIELNRKINETLEAMAQAIFKEWFVKPIESGTSKGWRLGTLSDLVELHQDRVNPTPVKDRMRYIALEDMSSKTIDLSRHQMGSGVNSSIISFRKGDILFGSMRPYFHKVGLVSFDGITRTTTFVLRPKTDRLRHFALLHFFSDEVVEFSTTASVGSTIPYVKWDALRSYEISIPPDSQLDEFEPIASVLTKRVAANGEESQALASIRDALLPRLLSGEIKIDQCLSRR